MRVTVLACQLCANGQGYEQGLSRAATTLTVAEGTRWRKAERQPCIHYSNTSLRRTPRAVKMCPDYRGSGLPG